MSMMMLSLLWWCSALSSRAAPTSSPLLTLWTATTKQSAGYLQLAKQSEMVNCSTASVAYILLDPFTTPRESFPPPVLRTSLGPHCHHQLSPVLHLFSFLLTVDYDQDIIQIENIYSTETPVLLHLTYSRSSSAYSLGSASWNLTNMPTHAETTLSIKQEGERFRSFPIALQRHVLYNFQLALFQLPLTPTTHSTTDSAINTTQKLLTKLPEKEETVCQILTTAIQSSPGRPFTVVSDYVFRHDSSSLLYWLDVCQRSLPVVHIRGFAVLSSAESEMKGEGDYRSPCTVKYVQDDSSSLKQERSEEDEAMLHSQLTDVHRWDSHVLQFQAQSQPASRLYCVEDVLQTLLPPQEEGVLRYLVATSARQQHHRYHHRLEVFWRELITTLQAAFYLRNLTKIEIRAFPYLPITGYPSLHFDTTAINEERIQSVVAAAAWLPQEAPSIAVGVHGDVFLVVFVSPVHLKLAQHLVNSWMRSCPTVTCLIFARIRIIPIYDNGEDADLPAAAQCEEGALECVDPTAQWKGYVQRKPSLRSVYLETKVLLREMATERDVVIVLNGLEALLSLPGLMEASTERTSTCRDDSALAKKWRLVPEVHYGSFALLCLPTYLVFADASSSASRSVNANMMLGQAASLLRFLEMVTSVQSAAMSDGNFAQLVTVVVFALQRSNPFLVTLDEEQHFFEQQAAQIFLHQHVLPWLTRPSTIPVPLQDLLQYQTNTLEILTTTMPYLRFLLQHHFVNVIQCLRNELPTRVPLSPGQNSKEYYTGNIAATWPSINSLQHTNSSAVFFDMFDRHFFPRQVGASPASTLPPEFAQLLQTDIAFQHGNIDFQQKQSSLLPAERDLIGGLGFSEVGDLSHQISCTVHFDVFLQTHNNLIHFVTTADWLTLLLVIWQMHERARFCTFYYLRNSGQPLEEGELRDHDSIYMNLLHRMFQLSAHSNLASGMYSVAHFEALLHLLQYAERREQAVFAQLQHAAASVIGSLDEKKSAIIQLMQQASKDVLAMLHIITPQIATQFLPLPDAKTVLYTSMEALLPTASFETVQKVRVDWDNYKRQKLVLASTKVHFVTFASNETQELQHLMHSAILAGIKLQVSGLGEVYRHYGDKIRGYYRVLHRKKASQYSFKDDDIVVLLDAYDVLIFSGVRRLKDALQHSPTPIVFNAEYGIYPELLGPTAFPRGRVFSRTNNKSKSAATGWLDGRFINSGVIVGRAKELRHLFAYAHHFRDVIRDDQQVFYRYLLANPATISIDENRLLSCSAFKSQHLLPHMLLSFGGELFLNLTTPSSDGVRGVIIDKAARWRKEHRDMHSIAFFHANNRKSNILYDTLVQYLDTFRQQYIKASSNPKKVLQLIWAWVDRDLPRVRQLAQELGDSKDVLVQQLLVNLQEVEQNLLS